MIGCWLEGVEIRKWVADQSGGWGLGFGPEGSETRCLRGVHVTSSPLERTPKDRIQVGTFS